MKNQNFNLSQIGRITDISTVRTDVIMSEVDQLIDIVKSFHCICASPMPCVTKYVIDRLADTPETVVTGVVSFPAGADTTSMKVFTAKEMVALGCKELDMVINVGALKSGQYDIVHDDIKAVVDAADGVPVKSILEICYLTDDEIRHGSELAVKAGVTFVKTGTGWGPKPTTVETVRLIKQTIGDSAMIKAAGGVRNLDTMLAMIDAGCNRFGIGIRSAMNIFQEAYERAGIPLPELKSFAASASDNY